MKAPNIVFFGTPGFAETILKSLIENDLKPVAVVTQPDKPASRGQKIVESPVKLLAKKHNIKIFQPEKLDEKFVSELKTQNSKLFIVAAYGKILPKAVLDIPKYSTLNVHASLLPKYRGASPIQAAILNGEKETGVTIMRMDERMDEGPILSAVSCQVSDVITADDLSKKLAVLGADLLIKTIPDYTSGKIKPTQQDNSKATYTKIIKKEDGHINWNKNCEEIERETRAFHPWPSAFAFWQKQQKTTDKKQLTKKILKVLPPVTCHLSPVTHPPGTVILTEKKELAITASDGYVIPAKLQLEGKKPMNSKEFLNGYPKIIGSVLN